MRILGTSCSRWISLFFAIVIGSVILSYIHPVKTNRDYLKEIINTGYIELSANAFIDAAVKKNGGNIHDPEVEKIKKELAESMLIEAKNYLDSGDSYLDKRANKETPRILAERLFKSCGVIE